MTPASGRNARTKLEEDIKVPFKSLYSHSTTQPIRRKKNLNKLNGGELFAPIHKLRSRTGQAGPIDLFD